MGGSSKKVTVGYRYYVGFHMVFCHGPVDSLSRIRIDKKIAWDSGQVGSGQLTINAPDLFGGQSREGGVTGKVDLEMGEPTQGQNSYLTSVLGPLMPNFRGVVGLIARQAFIGLNPYLKKWDCRFSRIHVRQDGIAQWYDSKAEIGTTEPAPVPPITATSSGWRYLQVALTDTANYASPAFDDSGWSLGQSPFASAPNHPYSAQVGFPAIQNTNWDLNTKLWMRINFTVFSSDPHVLDIFVDNYVTVWVNGIEIYPRNGVLSSTSAVGFHHTVLIPASVLNTGDNLLVMMCEDFGEFSYAAVKIEQEAITQNDMNPAHIIRECLTDPDWGMGYQEIDVDDTSFVAAANTLFDEGMGMSLLWDRQGAIEGFIQEILRHIDATLYVDRKTGLFVLKLIRGDYTAGSLTVLDESNVSKVGDYRETAFGELTNSVTVNYWNSVSGETSSLTVQDIALAQMQGAVINTTLQYPGFTSGRVASRVAMRDLKALSIPLVSCTIFSNQIADEFNIGDVFKFSWAEYEVFEVIMRITAIAFGDGKRNQIKITATQDVFSLADNPIIPSAPILDFNDVEPIAVTFRAVFEVPYLELVQIIGQVQTDDELTSEPLAGYVGAGGIRPISGSVSARLNTDPGTGYTDADSMEFCPGALLTDAIGPTDSAGVLVQNVIDLEEIPIGGWAQIDDELIAITAVSETSFNITRGVLDTIPAPHAAGSAIICWDAYAEGDSTQYVLGEQIGVKLLTVTGLGKLDLADAPEDVVTLNARAIRPYPPGNAKINTVAFPTYIEGPITATWVHRDRTQQTSDDLVGYTDGSVGPEVGTTYNIQFSGEDGLLKRTYSGVTILTQAWPTETADSRTYGQGDQNYTDELFGTGLPPSYATFEASSSTASLSADYNPKMGAIVLASTVEQQAYWDITSLPYFFDFDLSVNVEMIADPLGDQDFGLWLSAGIGTPAGYRLSHRLPSTPDWDGYIFEDAGVWTGAVKLTGALLATPVFNLNQRYWLRVVWSSATGLLSFYVDGVKIFEFTNTVHKKLRPGIFLNQCTLRVHQVLVFGNEADDRLNNQVGTRLASVVDGRESWQPYDFTTTRVGYGYSFGESYGGLN